MSDLRRLKEVVASAVDLPKARRRAYLDEACAGNEELRREAAELVELSTRAEGLLDASPVPHDEPLPPLEEGTRLGAWRVLSLIDSGGMGDVYLAERHDGTYEQRVAVKVSQSRVLWSPELRDRFLAERQLLAELRHPNILSLVDGGETDDGRPYLVMEHVEGEPVDRYCESHGLTVEERLRLFLEVCGAVRHAHERLVVHRDLKPSNVLVDGEGVPKLLDFGVAKDVGGNGKTPLTRAVAPMTAAYASPELLTQGTVTTAVDVYALGVILYELLTGESPFGNGDDPLAGRTRASLPRPPSTRTRRWRRRLAGDLDHVVLKALEPDLAERYSSVEQLARDLELHLRGLPLESRGGAVYRLGKLVRRQWKGLVTVVAVSVLAAVLVGKELDRRYLERENQRVRRVSDKLGSYLYDIFRQADPRSTGERNEALEQMLDRGVALLSQEEFAEEPLTRASLLGAVGQILRRQGRLDEAEPFLRECLELRRQHLRPDVEVTGRAANNLGLLLRARGRYAEALPLLKEGWRVLTLHHPGDSQESASALNNLAGVERELELFENAVTHYREALAMKKRLGFGPGAIATAIKNLGTGLLAAGRLDEAETTFQEARAELSLLDEPEPRVLAGIEHYLGIVLRERGDVAGARELLEHALEIRTQRYSPGHRQLLETRLELALVEHLEGRPDVAEDELRQIVELGRGQDTDVAKALVSLARLLAERGDVAAAVAAAEEALVFLRGRLPDGHGRIVEVEELLNGGDR